MKFSKKEGHFVALFATSVALLSFPATALSYDAELIWGAVSGANGYKVYIRQEGQTSPSGSDAGLLVPGLDGLVRYTARGLSSQVRSYFSIASYNSSGESARSNELAVDGTGSAPAPTPTFSSTTPPPTSSWATPTATYSGGGGCSGPIIVPATGGIFTGTTSGASTLAGSCSLTDNSPEKVFQWTPSVSGTAVIETCGSGTNFDTVLYLRGTSCSLANDVSCNDDTPGCPVNDGSSTDRGSRLTIDVAAGQSYHVVVDGWNTASGTFTLSLRVMTESEPEPIPVAPTPTFTATPVRTSTAAPTATFTEAASPFPTPTFTATPAAGDCSGTIRIPAEGGVFTGTTRGASALRGGCTLTDNSPEQVFEWTPPASGPAVIETCGGATSFDTVLYLRGGSCEDAGSEVTCNDDTAGCWVADGSDVDRGSRLNLNVTGGQTYFIVVDGWNTASGNFRLRVDGPSGPPPTMTPTASPSPTFTFTPEPTPTEKPRGGGRFLAFTRSADDAYELAVRSFAGEEPEEQDLAVLPGAPGGDHAPGLAIGDVDGDGQPEVVIGEAGSNPRQRRDRIEIYTIRPGEPPSLLGRLAAFNRSTISGSANLAVADVDPSEPGDEIIVGEDGSRRRASRLRVFGGFGTGLPRLLGQFRAVRGRAGTREPLTFAAGRVFADGEDGPKQIVVGDARGAVSVFRIERGRATRAAQMSAFPDPPRTSARRLAVGDLLADRPGDEVVVGDDGTRGDALVRVLDPQSGSILLELTAFEPGEARDGLELWVADVFPSSPGSELIVGQGSAGGNLRVFTLGGDTPRQLSELPDPDGRTTILRAHLGVGALFPGDAARQLLIAQPDSSLPIEVYSAQEFHLESIGQIEAPSGGQIGGIAVAP